MNTRTIYTRTLIQEYIELYNRALPIVKRDMKKSGRSYSAIQFIRFDTEIECFICVADVSSNGGSSRTQLNLTLDYVVQVLHEDEMKKKEKAEKMLEEARLSRTHSNGRKKKDIMFDGRNK